MDHAFQGLAGGLAIGAAAAMLLLLLGRIAGVSGILGSALSRTCADRGWRIAFLVGLPIGAVATRLVAEPPEVAAVTSLPGLLLAGGLVGFGTRLGSGCTSGHGVCGLARRSRRSLVATVTFMAAGIATVLLERWLGLAG